MIENTNRFRPAAIHFEEHQVYTRFEEGSRGYLDYWKEEARRSLDGYTVDGIFIPGYFYFYLNYCPIYLVEPTPNEKGEIVYNDDGTVKGDRKLSFPKFWDYDLDYFLYLHKAEYGIEVTGEDGIKKKEGGGKHGVTLKSRGKGYSFKHAGMLNRNFFLIPGSKSYAFASSKEYLLKDGLLTKAWEMMDFINEHTAWRKRRQVKDTELHKRASYKASINGKPIEKGYKSEIIGVTLKNNPNAARGKRGKLILFEEAGSFPHLLTAWTIARPSMEQGSTVFGLMIGYGTGGEEGPGFEGLNELFENPKGYNILPVDNVWDEGQQNKQCGFFVPDYMNKEGFMDKDGNSDILRSIAACEKERDIVLKETKDRNAAKRFIAEHCNTPREAMLRLEGNNFPSHDLLGILARLERDPDYEKSLFKGKFILGQDGAVEFKENKQSKIIYSYPYRGKEGNPDAPVIIYEEPFRNGDNIVPHGLYIGGIDPYDHNSSSTGSLGSLIIINKLTNRIVFEYTARPDTARDFYEQCRRALLYYNARALFENEKKGIWDYFESQGATWLLCEEPKLINEIIKKPGVSRRYGLKMPDPIKIYGEGLIDMWLRKDYNFDKGIKVMHKIRAQALIKELVAYSKDANTDRCMALMCALYQLEEERKYIPDTDEKPKSIQIQDSEFFNRGLFTNRPPNFF